MGVGHDNLSPKKIRLLQKFTLNLRLGQILLGKGHKLWNMYMRYGTWNIMTASKELSKGWTWH
jgi:hypothetical protein